MQMELYLPGRQRLRLVEQFEGKDDVDPISTIAQCHDAGGEQGLAVDRPYPERVLRELAIHREDGVDRVE